MPHDTNERQWYDASKIIWSLFAALGAIVFAVAMALFGRLSTLEARVSESDAHRVRIEQKLDDCKASVERIERKLEK